MTRKSLFGLFVSVLLLSTSAFAGKVLLTSSPDAIVPGLLESVDHRTHDRNRGIYNVKYLQAKSSEERAKVAFAYFTFEAQYGVVEVVSKRLPHGKTIYLIRPEDADAEHEFRGTFNFLHASHTKSIRKQVKLLLQAEAGDILSAAFIAAPQYPNVLLKSFFEVAASFIETPTLAFSTVCYGCPDPDEEIEDPFDSWVDWAMEDCFGGGNTDCQVLLWATVFTADAGEAWAENLHVVMYVDVQGEPQSGHTAYDDPMEPNF